MSDPEPHSPKPGISGKKVVIVFLILGLLFIAGWSTLAIMVFKKQSMLPQQQEKVGPK